MKLYEKAAHGLLRHAVENAESSDGWQIVCQCWTLNEISELLRRTFCRDLDSAIRTFEDINAVTLARLKGERYRDEQSKPLRVAIAEKPRKVVAA